jgi:hypothetical protein
MAKSAPRRTLKIVVVISQLNVAGSVCRPTIPTTAKRFRDVLARARRKPGLPR